MSESDEEIIAGCLSGRQQACRQLYARHAPRVMAYLLRSGFSAADAEDMVQETFSRAFRSLATFDRSRGAFTAWMGTVVRNVARRRWSRRTEAESFDPQLAEEMFASPVDPADTPEAREEMQALTVCIAALPETLGRFVRMRYVAGRTTRGIAATLGIPESTVRLKLKDAIARIERCMKDKGHTAD